MFRKVFLITTSCLACFTLAAPAFAQNVNRFAFNVGGGFTAPVRHSDSRLDMGFNVGGGAGINFTRHLGVMGEFSFNQLGLSSAALAAAGVPDGTSRIYSLTLNPIVRFHPNGRFNVYATGGGGYYRRTIEFTQPTIATITAFDPFWGVFFPVPVVANEVLGSFSQNKGGLNIGGGFEVKVRGDSNAKFYAETRYHYLYTTPVRTTILPVTFGFRW